MQFKKIFPVFLFAFFSLPFVFSSGSNQRNNQNINIAVFIPGVMSGSPVYEMLAHGAERAVNDFNADSQKKAEINIIEGGFNQAEWENQVTALAASGNYDLIISSNPSLPVIAASVSAKFPHQKFLLLDGELAGNPSIYTLRYNQREQAYMAGYLSALITLEINPSGRKLLGLVAAQEYPVMNNTILPAYLEGAQAVDRDFSVDFRIIGNWFDAAKGAELAAGMIRNGVNVLLPVAGGAGEGVVQAASESGAKVIWFDTNGYNVRPGTVVGSAILHQDKAAYEKTMLFLKNELPFGRAETAGIRDSYVDFAEDDPLYISSVSSSVRERQAAMIARIRSGALQLDN